METKELVSSGCALGFKAESMARESPMSHVLVARATVVNVIVPKSMALARDDTGAPTNAAAFDPAIFLLTDQIN